MVHEDPVPATITFPTVAHAHVGPRVQLTLDISRNPKLQIAKIKFK